MPDALPPVARRVPTVRTLHGDSVTDDYQWLKDRDDPETLAYLKAENAYTDEVMAPTEALQQTLFEEIKSRIQETDLSVPARKGPWWYYARTVEGLQYQIHCRRPQEAHEQDEQVLLDANSVAGESPYFALGAFSVSPDHGLLGYSTDYEGDEDYTIRFKDLSTGEVLADEIPHAYYGLAWAADNATVFYTTLDEAHRPFRVWRHRVGTDPRDDALVYEETDERFFVDVGATRSERFIVIHAQSRITSEVRVIPAGDPTADPTVIDPRRHGVEYQVEHHGDRFFIVTNDEALDFRLVETPVATPGHDHWSDVIAHQPGTRVAGADAFAGHLVVELRKDGLTGLRVIDLGTGTTHDLEFDEVVYTVGPGANPEFDSNQFRLGYESLVTPSSVYDYDLDNRTLTLKKRQPVLGGYDPAEYESVREWATTTDGHRVPISIVHRRGMAHDGSAPAVLYGYGAYETSIDPWFSAARLSLLERGFVFAVAHIRGGGELGRSWYLEGKLLAKRNTFTDYIACAEHLCALRYSQPDRLVARGGSAGGLLMGAVANLAPDRFRAVVAEVPFVDCVNTMIDPSLPLTITEWEEWGNPLEGPDMYQYMKGYSPYENLAPVDYPAILATGGLTDPRVLYHEPAKWVARMRTTIAGAGPPGVLLKMKLDAGHGGASGRYDAWKEEAFVLAFVLTAVGR